MAKLVLVAAAIVLVAGCGSGSGLSIPGGGTHQSAATTRRAHPTFKVIYTFSGGDDGATPTGSIVFDSSGNAYGATVRGGISKCGNKTFGPGCGVVFELSPRESGSWHESRLYVFRDHSDGGFPGAGVVLDANGNVFGTTTEGGIANPDCSAGCGVVYELSKSSGWTESVLHPFDGADGAYPTAPPAPKRERHTVRDNLQRRNPILRQRLLVKAAQQSLDL
jgi:hypothetical protein